MDKIGFAELLLADGPDPAYEDEVMAFGQLVGSWDVASRYYDREGNIRREGSGEWHFAWTVEGRGVIDVLLSPPAAEQVPGEPWFEWGITVRVWDPQMKAWRVTFVPTGSSFTTNLIGRVEGGDNVLDTTFPDGHLERWRFTEITDRSFLWQGRRLDDAGETWVLEEELRCTRRD